MRRRRTRPGGLAGQTEEVQGMAQGLVEPPGFMPLSYSNCESFAFASDTYMRDMRPGLGYVLLAGFAAAPQQLAIASDYLSIEEAQKELFPQAEQFREVVLALTPVQRARVAELAGPQPPHRSLRAFKAIRADQLEGYVFVDEVIGKQDFITYALGIDSAGALRTPEVLAYRESHGGEIRSAAWRRQFAGRHGLERLQVATDIKNIAGATLSCEHVTAGIRWLTALWQVALAGTA
jgi:hypothetical protein